MPTFCLSLSRNNDVTSQISRSTVVLQQTPRDTNLKNRPAAGLDLPKSALSIYRRCIEKIAVMSRTGSVWQLHPPYRGHTRYSLVCPPGKSRLISDNSKEDELGARPQMRKPPDTMHHFKRTGADLFECGW